MWFAVAIAFIILGISLIALAGFFGRFPDNWEWIGIVLAGVGLVMAVPSAMQMTYGRSLITLRFGIEDKEKACFYHCEVYNMPIKNRLLRKLGVRKEAAQDVVAMFEIRERVTGRCQCPLTVTILKTQSGVGAERISLPASLFPAIFAIIYVDKNTNEVSVMREPKSLLPVGEYTAEVKVVEGQDTHIVRCNFVIADKYPFVYWDVKS